MTDASPRLKARIAGAFYLLTIAGGMFAEGYVRSTLIAAGDAGATAANILASQPLYRLGIAADLIALVCYVPVTLLFYELFKPVSRSLSLLAALFSVAGVAVLAIDTLNLFAVLNFLDPAPYLTAFAPGQSRAMAYSFLKLHGQGYSIDILFFGFYCLLIGYIIFRSTFLPRILGVLLAIAGLCYLFDSFAAVLSPPLLHALSSYVLLPGLVGEGALCLWLMLVGLDPAKWERRSAPDPAAA